MKGKNYSKEENKNMRTKRKKKSEQILIESENTKKEN